MKVYIAGAITGDPDYAAKFKAAEEKLIECGHAVINPAKNQGFSYKEYIDMGLFELMHCEAIYLLDGWQTSPGACLERHYATLVGLKIYLEDGSEEEK